MIQRKGTNVYNKGKKIKEFEDEDDAESFANALSMMGEKKIIKENKVQRLYTSINEFKQHLLSEGKEFEYMLLSRLKTDCEYFLGNGNGSERVLWADTVDEHIDKMKELYNSVDPKPEWISMEDIEDFEIKMSDKLDNNLNERRIHEEQLIYFDYNGVEIGITELEELIINKIQVEVDEDRAIIAYKNEIPTPKMYYGKSPMYDASIRTNVLTGQKYVNLYFQFTSKLLETNSVQIAIDTIIETDKNVSVKLLKYLEILNTDITNESKHLVTESNITQDDLDDINDALPDEKVVNRFFISYYADNIGGKPVIVIDVSGKRGRPSEAYLMALRTNKPKLPSGYKYVSGKAIDYSGKPVTRDSIKDDDEYYDDRGYTDSEFDGEVLYEIEKTKTNESV